MIFFGIRVYCAMAICLTLEGYNYDRIILSATCSAWYWPIYVYVSPDCTPRRHAACVLYVIMISYNSSRNFIDKIINNYD